MDYGRSEAVLYLLIAKMFPEQEGRAARALNYLNHRSRSRLDRDHSPWDDTPLSRAITGRLGGNPLLPPPPPPPPGKRQDVGARRSFSVGRVKVLLALGANPNERVHSGSADWTPLALAVAEGDVEAAEALLERGADANGRWCAPIAWRRTAPSQPPADCTPENGTTPLMLAASLGNVEALKLLLERDADPQLAIGKERLRWTTRWSRKSATLTSAAIDQQTPMTKTSARTARGS